MPYEDIAGTSLQFIVFDDYIFNSLIYHFDAISYLSHKIKTNGTTKSNAYFRYAVLFHILT